MDSTLLKDTQLLSSMLELDLQVFEKGELQKLLALEIPWLAKLTCLQTAQDIDALIDEVPEVLKEELLAMKRLAQGIDYARLVFSPLYYVKMRYYNAVFFRFIDHNATLGVGGSYDCEGVSSSGFGLYTDEIIEILLKRDGHK